MLDVFGCLVYIVADGKYCLGSLQDFPCIFYCGSNWLFCHVHPLQRDHGLTSMHHHHQWRHVMLACLVLQTDKNWNLAFNPMSSVISTFNCAFHMLHSTICLRVICSGYMVHSICLFVYFSLWLNLWIPYPDHLSVYPSSHNLTWNWIRNCWPQQLIFGRYIQPLHI